jgi:hypothetical protein
MSITNAIAQAVPEWSVKNISRHWDVNEKLLVSAIIAETGLMKHTSVIFHTEDHFLKNGMAYELHNGETRFASNLNEAICFIEEMLLDSNNWFKP